jgi:gamma-glutamyltranspeptidase/glutathione hydrolase
MYRPPAIGMHAMVSSGNALSSVVGLKVLMDGGNAVDAMLATSASLHVTSPFVNGMGGDLFALIYEAKTGKVHGFNGSGRAPAAMSIEQMNRAGHTSMPRRGAFTVSVPGCVDAWSQIHGRFGTVAWADLFRPAIAYAREGHPVGRNFSSAVAAGIKRFSPSWLATFAPDGTAPAANDVWRQPELAESLEMVAQKGRDALYYGDIGAKIVATVQSEGGLMTREDLAAHRGEWSEPVSTTYRGHQVLETAPNSQGMTALIALNILEEIDLAKSGAGTPETLRHQIEALRWAYADRDRYLTDPAFLEIPTAWLL